MKKMKSLFVAFLALTISLNAFSQDTIPTRDTVPTHQKKQMKDVFVMKDNKMWQIKAGEKSEMTTDLTLANGTIVMVNGTVRKTDGQASTLRNGQYVDMEGNIGEWKDDPIL